MARTYNADYGEYKPRNADKLEVIEVAPPAAGTPANTSITVGADEAAPTVVGDGIDTDGRSQYKITCTAAGTVTSYTIALYAWDGVQWGGNSDFVWTIAGGAFTKTIDCYVDSRIASRVYGTAGTGAVVKTEVAV